MLDASRNYFSVSDLLRLIKAKSMNQLNIFHWQTTDAHSFPLVLSSEPALAEKGAYRKKMKYSPEDVKTVIDFGMEHGVRVVHEIDMPAHTRSWAKAYPDIVTCADKFWWPVGVDWPDRHGSFLGNDTQYDLPPGYEFWSIGMRTLLKSQDLWDLVEHGYTNPNEENRLKDTKKKDSKALVIIQQAVHDSVFSQIVAGTTSKQVWSILHKEFHSDSKVIMIRLILLRRDLETLFMKSGESVQDFLSREMATVSQTRSYRDQISNQTIVAKVLRSLTPKFDHIVATIEESKDL
ncbi:hypothetical protein ACH5RR_023528 [Cinchona calisaya]|uniref:beta-N-acetylhexosaminidase n=1 Tax=Cinchona calisaya TaxID=153742 RepID=A0ABD2ZCT7_9GENT